VDADALVDGMTSLLTTSPSCSMGTSVTSAAMKSSSEKISALNGWISVFEKALAAFPTVEARL